MSEKSSLVSQALAVARKSPRDKRGKMTDLVMAGDVSSMLKALRNKAPQAAERYARVIIRRGKK
jgi:hypothetical protein